jgi:hypothetical protein
MLDQVEVAQVGETAAKDAAPMKKANAMLRPTCTPQAVAASWSICDRLHGDSPLGALQEQHEQHRRDRCERKDHQDDVGDTEAGVQKLSRQWQTGVVGHAGGRAVHEPVAVGQMGRELFCRARVDWASGKRPARSRVAAPDSPVVNDVEKPVVSVL